MMNDLYLNNPQLRALLIDCTTMVLIYGRRLGKSSEIISHLSAKRAFEMPRASFMLLGQTYKQILERTLPATKLGWQKRGYIEDVHYVVGKRPPPMWPSPYYVPSNWQHTITWFTGHTIQMASQDRAGLVNSLTVWGLYADEAKLLNEERFKEDALPTVSAPRHYFPDSPHNRSVVLCTSMPALPHGQWLFDYQKQMDPERIQTILRAAIEIERLRNKITQTSDQKSIAYMHREIRELQPLIQQARNQAVFFDEASTFANLKILGMDYFYQQQYLLKNKFRSEILNIRPKQTERAFYANMREEHWYTQYNYSYLDSLNYKLDENNLNCRQDDDLEIHSPLIIGMDFGASINCIVTCQRKDASKEFLTLKNHYVLSPNILDDVCDKWCQYYEPHPYKMLNFYYDNSGNNKQANSKITYAQQAAKIFRKNGWSVNMKTFGGANTEHHQKYLLINAALSGKDPRFPRLRFNQGNCEELKQSMEYAPSEERSNGLISKDKSSERSKTIAPQYATHLSDAFDLAFYGEFNDRFRGMDYGQISGTVMIK